MHSCSKQRDKTTRNKAVPFLFSIIIAIIITVTAGIMLDFNQKAESAPQTWARHAHAQVHAAGEDRQIVILFIAVSCGKLTIWHRGMRVVELAILYFFICTVLFTSIMAIIIIRLNKKQTKNRFPGRGSLVCKNYSAFHLLPPPPFSPPSHHYYIPYLSSGWKSGWKCQKENKGRALSRQLHQAVHDCSEVMTCLELQHVRCITCAEQTDIVVETYTQTTTYTYHTISVFCIVPTIPHPRYSIISTAIPILVLQYSIRTTCNKGAY